jgi:O-antigen ligase
MVVFNNIKIMLGNLRKINFFDVFFVLLILSVPYSLKVPNALLVILTSFLILDYKKHADINIWLLKKKAFYVLFVLVFYWLLKAIITSSIKDTNYTLLLPVVILPVLFIKVKNKELFLWANVILVFLLSLRAIFGLLTYYIENKQFLPFEGEIINDILGMERPYLGFISVIGFISSLYLAMKYNKLKKLFIFYSIYIAAFIFLISARISAVTILFLIVIYLLFYIKKIDRNKALFVVIVITTIFSFVVLNKNLRERFFITSDIKSSVAKLSRHEPRMIIWSCAYDIATAPDFNPIFGLNSEKELEQRYIRCYDEKITNRNRADYFISTKINSHNQFIDVFLFSGIIGLGLFFYFFIVQIFSQRRNYFKIAMLISLILFLAVENVLRRQMGIYCFILIITFINIVPLNFNSNGINDK